MPLRFSPRVARRTALAAAGGGFLLSCGSDAPDAPAGATSCTGVELIVAASDYTSSVLCGAPGCVASPRTTGVDLGRDPALTVSNGRAFYLARDNELVFEVDPACGAPVGEVSVQSLARSSDKKANPHDAAAAPDGTVIVPLYDAARLAFIKDGAIAGSLDLASYDTDGNPQADAVSVVVVGGQPKAFVTLERLDDANQLRSSQASQMLRIDVATRTVEAKIDLAGRNPFNPMSVLDGVLFLAEPGNFDTADEPLAGIERFDTASSTTALLVHEHDLGGSVSEIAVSASCGAAIVAGPEQNVNPTKLVTFDPQTGRVLSGSATAVVPAPALGPTAGYDLQGLAWRDHTLYVGDRRLGGTGYPVHVLEDKGACALVDTGRTILLPQRPVALRAATP